MHLKLENFGPIESAELDVLPFTIIVGKNNMGKSYLAQLIHVLKNLQIHRSVVRPSFARRVEYRTRFNYEQVLELLEKGDIDDVLPEINNIIDKSLRAIVDYATEELRSLLEETFALPIEMLININQDISIIKFYYTNNANFEVIIEKDNKISLNLQINRDKLIKMSEDALKNLYKRYKDRRAIIRFSDTINRIIITQIFGSAGLPRQRPRMNSFYIPAGRAGLIEGIDIVTSAIMRLSTVAPIRGLSIPPLSGTTSQFYTTWITLRDIPGKYAQLGSRFRGDYDSLRKKGFKWTETHPVPFGEISRP